MSDYNHAYYLKHMDIDVWQLRPQKKPSDIVSLDALTKRVSNCTRCPLHASRTQTVCARGNPRAPLMIIGGVPGVDDDKQGLPFVGKAGALLNRMLASIQLTEHDVYMANILKCKAPDHQDPTSEDIEQCSEYLTQQIKAVQPKLILAVGHLAAQTLLQAPSVSLTDLRHKLHHYLEKPVIVTYHPAHLLRHPEDKKNAYQDLLWLQATMSLNTTTSS